MIGRSLYTYTCYLDSFDYYKEDTRIISNKNVDKKLAKEFKSSSIFDDDNSFDKIRDTNIYSYNRSMHNRSSFNKDQYRFSYIRFLIENGLSI